MKFVTVRRWLMASVCSTFTVFMTGCVTFAPAAQSQVKQLEERPYLAVLPVTFDLAITRLTLAIPEPARCRRGVPFRLA